ncbi:unnamed protein product [Brassica napus]|uniref:(rape) hypothetical protein n=1 Tax=Brassica napus TaxID=3708 RepID=A0A817BBW4_BRANA|nr:unnamed protein product [Brassica napus]
MEEPAHSTIKCGRRKTRAFHNQMRKKKDQIRRNRKKERDTKLATRFVPSEEKKKELEMEIDFPSSFKHRLHSSFTLAELRAIGLWGWQCKSSPVAKENCALRCLSPVCYQLIYESEPLEEGEKDLVRSQEYKYCYVQVSFTTAFMHISLSLVGSSELDDSVSLRTKHD